jgi:hypothetical protein
VRAQTALLKKSPYKADGYKLLRKLFTDAKRPDAAWCLCQALSVMNLAAPDEERFYKKHRADGAAPAQATLSDDEWSTLAHPDLDPLVTRLFALVEPSIVRARTEPLDKLGYDVRYAIDTQLHPYPISQMLHYALAVLGLTPPLVFQNTNEKVPEKTGLGFLHAKTPGIVLGRAAFDPELATQAMAFMAGRHLSYFRPGHYVRHVVPTGTGLKAWLFAAIRLCVPQFPVATELVGPVQDAQEILSADFTGAAKEMLASVVGKLIQAGNAVDLKKWVAGVDSTADRAGLLLAHDLGAACEAIKNRLAPDDPATARDRAKELVLFSVSEPYFDLRAKLQIAIDS